MTRREKPKAMGWWRLIRIPLAVIVCGLIAWFALFGIEQAGKDCKFFSHFGGPQLSRDELWYWLGRSAEMGDPKAQLRLGNYLAFYKKYTVEAYMWVSVSVMRGEKEGTVLLDYLKQHMTPAEIALAEKEAREWKPTAPTSLEFRSSK